MNTVEYWIWYSIKDWIQEWAITAQQVNIELMTECQAY